MTKLSSKRETRVIALIRVPGFHQWSHAPEEVAFLRARHRHLFTFRVECSVGGDDRLVEFFLLQREMRRALQTMVKQGLDGFEFGESSCEMLCHTMRLGLLKTACTVKVSAVEVWEDDECGARVEFVTI